MSQLAAELGYASVKRAINAMGIAKGTGKLLGIGALQAGAGMLPGAVDKALGTQRPQSMAPKPPAAKPNPVAPFPPHPLAMQMGQPQSQQPQAAPPASQPPVPPPAPKQAPVTPASLGTASAQPPPAPKPAPKPTFYDMDPSQFLGMPHGNEALSSIMAGTPFGDQEAAPPPQSPAQPVSQPTPAATQPPPAPPSPENLGQESAQPYQMGPNDMTPGEHVGDAVNLGMSAVGGPAWYLGGQAVDWATTPKDEFMQNFQKPISHRMVTGATQPLRTAYEGLGEVGRYGTAWGNELASQSKLDRSSTPQAFQQSLNQDQNLGPLWARAQNGQLYPTQAYMQGGYDESASPEQNQAAQQESWERLRSKLPYLPPIDQYTPM